MLGGGGGPSPAPVKGRWRVLLLPLPAGLSPRVCGDAAEGTDWGMGVSAAGVNKRVWGVCRTRSRHSVLGGGGAGEAGPAGGPPRRQGASALRAAGGAGSHPLSGAGRVRDGPLPRGGRGVRPGFVGPG